jgi:hypothetical protein
VSGLVDKCKEVNHLYEKVTVGAFELVNCIRSTLPMGQRSSRTKYVFLDNIPEEGQGEGLVSRRNLVTQTNSTIGGHSFNPSLPAGMYFTGLQPSMIYLPFPMR